MGIIAVTRADSSRASLRGTTWTPRAQQSNDERWCLTFELNLRKMKTKRTNEENKKTKQYLVEHGHVHGGAKFSI